MDDLITFLRARLEDEQADRIAAEAMRKVVDAYAEALRIQAGFREVGYEEGRREALELACRAYAAQYASLPEYQQKWTL